MHNELLIREKNNSCELLTQSKIPPSQLTLKKKLNNSYQSRRSKKHFKKNAYRGQWVIHKPCGLATRGRGVSEKSTLVYNSYTVKWYTKGDGGVKISKNVPHALCMTPYVNKSFMYYCTRYSTVYRLEYVGIPYKISTH